MFLGEKIKKIRTEAKLTQLQFSEILGVSQQSVQKMGMWADESRSR